VRSTCFFAVGFAAVASVTALAAPPPVITGTRPNPLVSTSQSTNAAVEIRGQNFWPSGPNVPSRWVLMVRRQYMPFQTIPINSLNNTAIYVDFPSLPLLNGVGQLEFMVKTDGVASNVFAVKIVADPPALASVLPDKIALKGTDEARWNVWLAGSRWPEPTTIWVNGVQAGKIFNNDLQELVWPAAFRKAGKYQVQVRSEHGGSELRTVEVVAPPPVYEVLTDSARENKDAALIGALATPTPDFAKLKTGETAAVRAKVKPTPTPDLSHLKIQ
jgi:hypothetical protein